STRSARQELVDHDKSAPHHCKRFMGTERIYQTVLRVATAHADHTPLRTHLEIGAGAGRLITLFRERFGVETRICDYTDALLKLPGESVDIVDLNQQKLPYADNSFDIVTATEVVEHLER